MTNLSTKLKTSKNDNILGAEEVDEKIDEKGWKTLIDFREIDLNGIKAKDLIKAIKKIDVV